MKADGREVWFLLCLLFNIVGMLDEGRQGEKKREGEKRQLFVFFSLLFLCVLAPQYLSLCYMHYSHYSGGEKKKKRKMETALSLCTREVHNMQGKKCFMKKE